MATQRTKEEYLGLYAEGWSTGDTEKVLQAVAPGFQFGDPEKRVSREEFRDYHQDFIKQCGNTLAITGVVTCEVQDRLIVACFWEAGGIRGTGLITVGANGVEREDVALL